MAKLLLHFPIQVTKSLYEKRLQAHVHAKLGNNAKKVTSANCYYLENVNAFAYWHNNKKSSLFGSCHAYDIAFEAGFIEENDSIKPSQWPQISAILFRDTRT